ncbi:MAG: putative transposase [Myxococcota bacterium]|jgi:putative transposase
MLKDAGVTPLLLPAGSPNLNAHVERFVLTVKSECLRKLVPLSERHLRYAIQQFAAHYHHERHHQGLAGQLVVPDEHIGLTGGRVARRERLGGLLNFYYREAA